jgi:hypothetical protein
MKTMNTGADLSRLMKRCGLLLAFGALAELMGCGGSGGGTSSTESAKVTLDRRVFRVTSGSRVGETRTERITGTVQVDGRTAFVSRDESGETNYFANTNTGRIELPGPTASAFAKAFGQIELARFGQAVGESLTLSDRSVSVDWDSDGQADSVDFRIDTTFIGLEDVTTSLASFKAAAHLRYVYRITVRYGGRAATNAYITTSDIWFAPGVGLVRTSDSSTIDGGAPSQEVEQLTGYSVGALRDGNVASALIKVSPNNGSVVNRAASIELIFDEQLNPSSLSRPGGPELVNVNGLTMPTTPSLSADGLRLVLTPPSPVPDGAYEVRTGSAVLDALGNAIAPTTRKFTLDTVAPKVVSTSPTRNATGVALTGEVAFRFSEPVFDVYNPGVKLLLTSTNTPPGAAVDRRTLPAVIRGAEVIAPISVPLLRDTEYVLSSAPGTILTDAAGNDSDIFLVRVTFRTSANP